MKLQVYFLVILLTLIMLISAGFFYFTVELPFISNLWFSSSGVCTLCHSTSDFALRDSQGDDVSPVARWRRTMLANASKDPFWKAKVRHEGIENHSHKDALENVCTRCHAPMGMLNAYLSGAGAYNLDSLKNDEIGKDGISCTLCHQINDFSSPLFSGNFEINPLKEIYGPYESPITAQMLMNTGYTPVYSEKINDSRLCGSCHTLLTNSADENGELTGETFVEQALYHEWENSVYGKENISCQSCHIPRIYEPVKITSRPGFAPGREPFGIHDFTGGNLFMLNLLRENHDELQLHSGTDLLAESAARTLNLLTKETVDLKITSVYSANDSLFVEVSITNKAGHKFPTGFPSRRAYLECIVSDDNDTLFHSGKPASAALTRTDGEYFEPHHEIINKEHQVQIYEFVMGDTKGQVTTVLEKAYVPLKDNRMVPEGFQETHFNYDTVKVAGKAIYDPDYFSGAGVEYISYAFPADMFTASSIIEIFLYYETVPESWLHDLFEVAEEDDDIIRFKNIYFNADRTPVLIASDSQQFNITSVAETSKHNVMIYPNPTTGTIYITGVDKYFNYSVYNNAGMCVKNGLSYGQNSAIDLRLPSGNYHLMINTTDGYKTGHSLILKK